MHEDEISAGQKQSLKEIEIKSKYLIKIKEMLFERTPASQQDFNLVILQYHAQVEAIFDRILTLYIGQKELEETTLHSLQVTDQPWEVLQQLIFNYGFENKLQLIYKAFYGLAPSLRGKSKLPSYKNMQKIKYLNKVRNAVAHRYHEDHEYYQYKKRNIRKDLASLYVFFNDTQKAVNELYDMEELLEEYFG